MKTNKRIYCDLDGVVLDWETAYAKWLGFEFDEPSLYYEEILHKTGTNFEDVIRIGKLKEFNKSIGLYEWAYKLTKMCEFYDKDNRLVFLTAVCNQTRVEMMKKLFPLCQIICTPDKFVLANPDSILIDDSDKFVDSWRKHGGKAVLFPQPWNLNRGMVNYRIDFTEYTIKHHSK